MLGEAPQEHHFYLRDGKRLKSLRELAEALENMSDDVFKHHVNEVKNDFSKWIEEIFGEKELAKEMKKAKSRIDTQLTILRHILKELS